MKISLKDSKGIIITISLNATDTIETLKQKISKEEGIAFDAKKLSIEGKEFEDSASVSSLDVQEKSFINLETGRGLGK